MINSFGFHGKIPSVGDFVTKRLQPEFVDKWDIWLQNCISSTKDEITERWTKTYSVAPILRFYLQQGLMNDMAWFGLMIPSVDSVGRQFPFSIFFSVKGNLNHYELMVLKNDWFRRFEEFSLQILNPNLNLNAWDNSSSSFLPISFCLNEINEMTIPIEKKNSRLPLCISYKEIGDIQNKIIQFQAGLPPYKSFWWYENDQRDCYSEIFITENLPSPARFPRMIGDQSQSFGWENSIYE